MERTKEAMARGKEIRYEVRGEPKQRVDIQENETSAQNAEADLVGAESLNNGKEKN